MIAKNNNSKNNEKKGKDSRKKKVRKLLKLELRSYSSILICPICTVGYRPRRLFDRAASKQQSKRRQCANEQSAGGSSSSSGIQWGDSDHRPLVRCQQSRSAFQYADQFYGRCSAQAVRRARDAGCQQRVQAALGQ